MHSVSSTYSRIVAAEGHKFDTKVEIAGITYYQKRNGYSQGTLRSVVTRAHTFGSDTIQLGKADSREIELEIFGTSSNIPRNAEMRVYVRAMNEAETEYSEWLPKGTFYIDTRHKDSQLINDDEVISIVGMDAMMRGETMFDTFPDSWLEEGKTTAIEAMEYAAQYLNVGIDTQTYRIMSRNFPILLPTQYTIRETLQNIAGLYGGSFIINDIGYLQLICPWYSASNYDLGVNTQSLTVYPPYDACSGVRMLIADQGYTVKRDDEDVDYYFSGSEYGYVFEIETPWATQEQADWLYNRMSGYVYVPYSSEAGEIDPKVEIGDTITIRSKDGNTTTGGLYTQEITFGKYFTCDFGAPGEEEIDHEYKYETSTDRKYTRRLYNAEATLAIHADEIMARVKKTDGNEEESFGWVLESDHWDIFSGDPSNVVLHVDKDGLTVKGDGEFTGTLSSAEIYIPSEDDWNFMVDRSGHMTATNADISGIIRADGGIYVGDESVATASDLQTIMNELHQAMQLLGGSYSGNGTGLINSLRAANNYNKAIKENDEYPMLMRAGTFEGINHFIGSSYICSDGHGRSYNLFDHKHSLSATENDGKIVISCDIPCDSWAAKDASFDIAATQFYKDRVAAIDVESLTPTYPLGMSYYPYYSSDGTIRFRIEYELGSNLDSSYSKSGTYSSTLSVDASQAYNAGYNYAERLFKPTDIDFNIVEGSGGTYYRITVTARNTSGNTLITRTDYTDTNVYYNGYNDGYDQGYDTGYNSGYDNGHSDGYSEGYDSGYYDGYDQGYSNGWNDGYWEGYEWGYADGRGSIY